MTAFQYRCTDCGRSYARDEVRYLCPVCGPAYRPGIPLVGVLEVVFDYAAIRATFDRERPDWNLFCAVEPEFHPPLAVGHTPLARSVRLGQDLGSEASLANTVLAGGYRHNLGAYGDAAMYIPVVPGFSLGPDLGIYSSRGVMLGPVANYDITSGDDTAVGYLKSGYIHDFGVKDLDVLGTTVGDNRACAEWQHSQQVTPDLSLSADVNWSTDSEVVRDFHS